MKLFDTVRSLRDFYRALEVYRSIGATEAERILHTAVSRTGFKVYQPQVMLFEIEAKTARPLEALNRMAAINASLATTRMSPETRNYISYYMLAALPEEQLAKLSATSVFDPLAGDLSKVAKNVRKRFRYSAPSPSLTRILRPSGRA